MVNTNIPRGETPQQASKTMAICFRRAGPSGKARSPTWSLLEQRPQADRMDIRSGGQGTISQERRDHGRLQVNEASKIRGPPKLLVRVYKGNMETRDYSKYCSVRNVSQGVVSIKSVSRHYVSTQRPRDIWDVVARWGHEWMWDQMLISGDGAWISTSIANRSCIAVTDGSYMKELCPTVNSATFVFKCQQGGGRLVGSFIKNTTDACS